MATYTSIRSAISTKLATVTELFEVFDYDHINFDGYPTATFEPFNNEDIFFTDKDNERKYQYRIILHQEMESGGRQNAIDILVEAVDAVITAFDEDPTLGGVVKACDPITTLWGQDTLGDGAMKIVEIQVVCKDLAEVATPA